jgi:hypothetical protein
MAMARKRKPIHVAKSTMKGPGHYTRLLRDKSIVRKYISGWSKEDLAQEFELAESTIGQIIGDRIRSYKVKLGEYVEEARAKELAMLDELQKANFDFAAQGSRDHANVVLSIHRSRKEMLGLDAPKRIEVQEELVTRVYQGVNEEDI